MSSAWLGNANVEARSAALGQLGDYFGGTLNPILSFSGFLVLLLTVVIQRRQLLEGTRQLEQSTRAIDLEAFAYPALRALAGDAGALAWAKRQNSELRVAVGIGQLNLSAQ